MATVCVIYSYFEKNEEYRTNLIYFLKHGYIRSPSIDYIFVVNGSHTVVFPQGNNIRVCLRENSGFDFQGYYTGLLCIRKKYAHYSFVNSSVRGPFIPHYISDFKWYQPFINLLKGTTKLVGCVINVQSPTPLFKLSTYGPHVQSYCFMMDNECMEYLMTETDLFAKQYQDKNDVITNQEIKMSTYVLHKGWNISCLIKEYQGVDYRNNNTCCQIVDDILWNKNSLGRVIHPFESMFSKTSRDTNIGEIETLTDCSLSINDMCYRKEKGVRVAICFHLGYGHMVKTFSKYIDNVYKCGFDIDLYVSYQKVTDPIYQIKQRYPDVILLKTTRGCDTGPFLLQLEQIYKSKKQYDYIFKIHTKKREDWRCELLDPIAGSPENVLNVCDNFRKNQQIGIIGGVQKWIHRRDSLNEPLISDMCKNLGIIINSNSLFMAGTIFWTRWSIYKQFIEDSKINFRKEYEKCELGYLINHKPTYTHSWERLFGHIVSHYNYMITPVILEDKVKIQQIVSGKLVSKVLYGLSPEESKNVTDLCLTKETIHLRTANINSLFGDPYPEKRKRLYIYTESPESVCVLDECASRLAINNYIFSSNSSGCIYLKLEDNTNSDNYMMYRYHEQIGRYITTYFDKLYYYQLYAPLLPNNTHVECLKHYIKYGISSGLSTFEPNKSLITKYKIKLLALYTNWATGTDIKKQAEQAKNIGLNGFCIQYDPKKSNYESLLSNKTIDIPFCFNWINTKTGNGSGNGSGSGSELEEDVSQFNCLLPFFKDAKYIKIGKSPIFVSVFAVPDRTVGIWDKLAKLNGFDGIKNIILPPIIIGKHKPHIVCRQLCQESTKQMIVNCGSSKTFYCGMKTQIERSLENDQNEQNNLIFINSWSDLESNEYSEQLKILIGKYNCPQSHDKGQDVFL